MGDLARWSALTVALGAMLAMGQGASGTIAICVAVICAVSRVGYNAASPVRVGAARRPHGA